MKSTISIGEAIAIFKDITRTDKTSLEKRMAIDMVLRMPTHNGIEKDEFIDVMRWEKGIRL